MITRFGDISPLDCFVPGTTCLGYEVTNKSARPQVLRIKDLTLLRDTNLM